jgi:hypothetical protein
MNRGKSIFLARLGMPERAEYELSSSFSGKLKVKRIAADYCNAPVNFDKSAGKRDVRTL